MEFFDIAETWDRAAIEEAQLVRLRSTLKQTQNSPFYAQRLAQAGLVPEKIQSLDDLRLLPLTTKEDLRSQYPAGLACVPMGDFVRMHCSSGTTGTPVAICHTQLDLHSWADLVARCMHMVGMRRTDTFQNMSGYGLFTGGLGIHAGAERLGCMTIPAGAGNSRRQVKLLQDFNVSAIHILPSYALHLASVLQDEGINPRELPVRIALIGAEPYTEGVRQRIEQAFGMRVYNSYGLSEMNGPGVAFECQEQNGLHVWEDAYFMEIIDPVTEAPLPDGEIGELVMTTLCRQGMPVLRYRTRDLTRILPGECACGRSHRRLDRILGRSDDMFIIKGVNIYPMQIEKVLMSIPEVGMNYLIVLEEHDDIDTLTVRVEVREESFVEDMRALRSVQQHVVRRLRDEILVTPVVELVQHNSLPQTEGKAQRVQDLRSK